MASMTIQNINRLAILLQRLLQRRAATDALHTQIDAVKKLGGTTEGEEQFIRELEQRLEDVHTLFQQLSKVANLDESRAVSDNIATVLDDYLWEDADFFTTSLGELHVLLQEEQRNADALLQAQEERWALRDRALKSAENKLVEAVNSRAAVAQERQEMKQLRSIVDAAQQALNERKQGQVDKSQENWDKSPRKPEGLQVTIEQAQSAALRIALQSDLILLQSPIVDNQYYDYTVLLRTRSERGQRGINIQDARKVVVPDRTYFDSAIKTATDQITNGWRTAVSRAGLQTTTRHFVEANSVGETLREQNIGALLTEVGEFMYRIIIPESMQSFLVERDGTITITTNDLELPWELMAYPRSLEDGSSELAVLCLDRPIGRIPMGYALPRREANPPINEGKKRFAFFYADPRGDLPGARQEVEKIIAGLEAHQQGNVEIDYFQGEKASGQQLNKILLRERYDVIHFAGHAGFDENDPEMSSLLLHNNELFFSEKVRTLLSGQPLIFLNACQTGRAANEQHNTTIEYMQKPAAGLASAFIYGGALGCIGSLWPIYDDAAAQFAIDLYNYLLQGHLIGEAVRLARVENKRLFANHITWASYVLYGNPILRLVT